MKMTKAAIAVLAADAKAGKKLSPWERDLLARHGKLPVPEKVSKNHADRTHDSHAAHTDIGSVGKCADPARRESCRMDLALFLTTYHPIMCAWPFSADHLTLIADLQRILVLGGRKVVAFPRGAGKTSICVGASEWALLYAHRRFGVVPAATEEAANNIIASVVADFESNELLLADFPEVCVPFARLQGVNQRAKSQHQGGKVTDIVLKSDEIMLPYVLDDGKTEYGPQCGSYLYASGLTGHIRGIYRVPRAGGRLRPDFVLPDDPQTRESARSEGQTGEREKLINGDVMKLSGHKKSIAAMMPCTVINRGDLAEIYLSKPTWQGQRVRAVKKWSGGVITRDEMPEHVRGLLEEYRDRWLAEKTHQAPDGSSRAFYAEHQAVIEDGVEVFWTEMYDHENEISTYQHCLHLMWEDGEYSFDAEMQQEPVADRPEAEYHLTADAIRKAIGMHARGVLPDDRASTVAFVDLNYHAAAWVVVSASNVPCYNVVDYGWWTPGRGLPVWSEKGAKETLEIAIYRACEKVTTELFAKPYGRELKAIAIDCGSRWASTVHAACTMLMARHNPPPVYAAKGFPGSQYREPYKRQSIKRRGYMADIRFMSPTREQMMQWDSHAWHMITQKGWLIPVGMPGSVALFKVDGRVSHSQFSEEAAADVLEGTEEKNGRTNAKWKTTGRNEMGDVVAGACALLSTDGVRPDAADDSSKRRREERKAKREARAAEKMQEREMQEGTRTPVTPATAAEAPKAKHPVYRARQRPWAMRF